MYSSIFGVLSGITTVIGIIPYIVDILRGKTKPERASWLIWTLLGSISFLTQMAEGATFSLVMTGTQTLAVVVVFILSIKFGVGGLTRRDFLSILTALIGIVLWRLTSNPMTALMLVIAVDAIGVYLTLIKSYKDPGSETLFAWILNSFSGLFGILSVGSLNFNLLLYPAYILIANISVVTAIKLGVKNQSKQ